MIEFKNAEDPNVKIDFTALRKRWDLNESSHSNEPELMLMLIAGMKIVDEKLDRIIKAVENL